MDSVTLAVQGSEHSIIVERSSWHDWWRGFRAELSGKRQAKKTGRRKTSSSSSQPRNGQMRCLLSGELIDPATTHGKIEGLRDVGGGKMGGDHLISFKQESFQSFGLRQAANAAMSEKMANVYRSTLKHLIANNGHRLAGSKVVYWYTGPSQEARELAEKHDPLGSMFGLDYGEAGRDSREQVPPQTPQARELRQGQANAKARDLLAAIRAGQLPGPLKDCRFCAVTLSGNAGRVVVRDWMEGEFEALASNVAAWFEDLRIISRDGSNDARNPKFTAVLFGMVRELKEMPAPLEAELWRCAVRNLPLPYQAMARALSRVRIDIITGESPTNARMGLLKAYLIRKGTQMEPSLMEGCKDPAYLSGRIMAVLADIQRAALGDVGAGVVQRYYAAASTTPALVLGRLVRLAQVGHLPKIDKGLQIWFDQQLADIWSRLTPQTLPKTLSLEQQTLFALGYYHQKASRKNGKDQEGQAALSAKA
jgi:CRISPR-associated protein Csd1